MDITGLSWDLGDALRAAITRATGIGTVLLNFSHTHNAPMLFFGEPDTDRELERELGAWLEGLRARSAGAGSRGERLAGAGHPEDRPSPRAGGIQQTAHGRRTGPDGGQSGRSRGAVGRCAAGVRVVRDHPGDSVCARRSPRDRALGQYPHLRRFPGLRVSPGQGEPGEIGGAVVCPGMWCRHQWLPLESRFRGCREGRCRALESRGAGAGERQGVGRRQVRRDESTDPASGPGLACGRGV